MNCKELVQNFREAIDKAKENGEFKDDISFRKFPRGCCGDASDLLAEFLLINGIETYYVCLLPLIRKNASAFFFAPCKGKSTAGRKDTL